LTAVKEIAPDNRNSHAMKRIVAFDRTRRRAWLVWFSVGALAAGAAVVAALLVARPGPSTGSAGPLLIYVGAEDCAPCSAWQKGDGVDFRRSIEFSRIRYREVKSQRLHELLNDAYWPEELRIYRSRLKPGDGVPLWLIVSGGAVVAQHSGAQGWRSSVLPALRSHLR
jgi:hypothetical protein